MEGESLTPNSNTTMGSASAPPSSGGSIDPTDYYGQSFDYNEWVKSKVKEIEGEQKKEEGKQIAAHEAKQEEYRALANKKLEEFNKELPVIEAPLSQKVEEFKKVNDFEHTGGTAYGAYLAVAGPQAAANAARHSDMAAAYADPEIIKLQKETGAYYQQAGINAHNDPRITAILAAKYPNFGEYTPNEIRTQLAPDAPMSASEWSRYYGCQYGNCTEPAGQLSNFTNSISSGKNAVSTALDNMKNAKTEADFKDAEKLYDASIENLKSISNRNIGDFQLYIQGPTNTGGVGGDGLTVAQRDQNMANATGSQVGSAMAQQQVGAAQSMANAGYELVTDKGTGLTNWVGSAKILDNATGKTVDNSNFENIFTGNAFTTVGMKEGSVTSDELQKSLDTSNGMNNIELKDLVNKIAMTKNAENAVKLSNLVTLYNSDPLSKNYAEQQVKQLAANNEVFNTKLLASAAAIGDKNILKEISDAPAKVGTVAGGLNIYSTSMGDVFTGKSGINNMDKYTSSLQLAMINPFGGNNMVGGQTAYNKQQSDAQTYLSGITGIKAPSFDDKISKLRDVGEIGGNKIYGSSSGDVVATENKQLTPLSTITALIQQQHGTGDFNKYADIYQDKIGTSITNDKGERQIITNSLAKNPIIDSMEAKNKLYGLLKNPDIKDPFATIDNTVITTERTGDIYKMPIVKYDQQDWIVPKTGLPIKLSDYTQSSDSDKKMMSLTPAENVFGDNYDKTDKWKIDVVNNLPKYGGYNIDVNGKVGIIGFGNSEKVISAQNEKVDPTKYAVYDKEGNVYSAVGRDNKPVNPSEIDTMLFQHGGKQILANYKSEILPDGTKYISDTAGNKFMGVKSQDDITTNPINILTKDNPKYDSIISQLSKQIATGDESKIDFGNNQVKNVISTPKPFIFSSAKENQLENAKKPFITSSIKENQIQNTITIPTQSVVNTNTKQNAIYIPKKQEQPGMTGLKNVLTRVSMPDLNMGGILSKKKNANVYRKPKQSKPKADIKKSSKKVEVTTGFNFDKLISNVSVKKDMKKSEGFNFDNLISNVSVKKKPEKEVEKSSKFNFDFKIPKIDISVKKRKVK